MKLPTHGRYDYVPLDKRKTYEWPNGTRLAVNFCNNIEHFAFGAGLGTDNAAGGQVTPNQRSYAWRDYGNRVGLWYWLDVMEENELPASHNINSMVLEEYPEIVERLRARADEFVGHGRSNAERQDVLWEEDEARLIRESTEVVTRLSGQKPEGWLGPYLAQTKVTLDLLKEAGYSYVQDWPVDDQPIWMRTRSGPILSVPYSVEVNDSPALVFRRQSAREFAEMMIDQFDEMLHQSKKRPLVYTVSVHPFIIGQPFRLHAFRRALNHILRHRKELWITTPGEVAKYCAGLPKGIVPGS
jgi:peptidoglycan/xylan/chitin deacetylase (PgdA/CDA1 family)